MSLEEVRPEEQTKYIEDAEQLGTSVEMNDWQSTEHGIIYTEAAATCIVPIFYNPKTKKAYMGHFSAVGSTMETDQEGRDKFTQMLDEIDKVEDDLSDFYVWLGAGNYNYGVPDCSFRLEILDDKNFAIEAISSLGIKPAALTVEWDEDKNTASDVYFDVDNGVLLVKKEEVDDEDF